MIGIRYSLSYLLLRTSRMLVSDGGPWRGARTDGWVKAYFFAARFLRAAVFLLFSSTNFKAGHIVCMRLRIIGS